MTNKKDCPVVFEKEGHKYVLKETGELLLSGSSFIGLFHDKFDPTGEITEKYAKKVKKTVDEVKEMWRVENKKSTDYGTAVHNTLEDFINTGEITNKEYAWVVEEFKKVPIYGNLVSEKMVYNEDLLLCGTVDLFDIYKNSKGVLCARILDFKTNKKLEIKEDKVERYVKESIRKFQIRDYSNEIRYDKLKVKTFNFEDVLEKFGVETNCYLSGEPINLYKNNYNLDHIIPVSRGGDNSFENLGIAHEVVNRMKSDLTPEELIEWCIKILTYNGYTVSK